MPVESFTDNIKQDISLSRARYQELLIAEHDCACLKNLIYEKAEDYGNLSYEELCVLKRLYFMTDKESEGEICPV